MGQGVPRIFVVVIVVQTNSSRLLPILQLFPSRIQVSTKRAQHYYECTRRQVYRRLCLLYCKSLLSGVGPIIV